MKKNFIFLSIVVALTIINIPHLESVEELSSQIVSEEFSIANSNSGGCESVFDIYPMGGCLVKAFDCYAGGPLTICWKGQYITCDNPPQTYGWEESVKCSN
jgi:hypothetical protein